MRLRSTAIIGLVFAIGALAGVGQRSICAQGYPPSEAARRMTVAEGLEVELFAAEPLVRQPVAIEFDDAGRLWVIQYLQYPNPSGLKRAKVDRYSRTTYDQVPEPPPRGPKGADRITILEDTDGDGRADSTKDFVSDLNLASGLAFGHGGVFVLQVPYLLFYPDRNRDDQPDGDPEVLLSGFGMEDAHSVANSLCWGPDGWLYGCQGSTVTAHVRGIEFQQGVWRYHPITRRFELFCEGGGNSWGLDFDDHGNLFYSTNYGGYAMLHGVQGGYYWKQFGKHGALHNPHAYGYFDHVQHAGLHGGHVTVGGIIYQGDSLPSEFRGKYIAADLLGHAAYWHELTPRGSTFSARHAGDLLLANDTWFAPSDVTMGPDGAIYICDWHDARTGHPDPDADWDRTNGRIYRIAARGQSPQARASTPKLAELSSSELVAYLGDTNDWVVRKARRLLADRRDAQAAPLLRPLVLQNTDAHLALEALWALYVSAGLDDELAGKLLEHPSADVRWWTIRLLGDDRNVSRVRLAQMAARAASDPSVAVRSQLASTAQRLPADQALAIIAPLLCRDEDQRDPFIPLLLWWAVERHALDARGALLNLVTQKENWKRPLVHDTILPRLVRRYAAEASEAGYLACARLLAAARSDDRRQLLTALDEGLGDRSSREGGSAGTLFANLATVSAEKPPAAHRAIQDIPAQLADELDRLWTPDTTDVTLIRLGMRLGKPAAQSRAVAIAGDEKQSSDTRARAVQLLGELGGPSSVDVLLALVSASDARMQLAAVEALGRFDDDRIGESLLRAYAAMPPALRTKTCDVLLGRKAGAARLLAAVGRGQIDAKEVPLDALRLVALHQEPDLDALVKKHWGSIKAGTPEERLAEMRRINNDLRAGPGDPRAGKQLYATHCGTCHRLFGEGNQIGPELTHANRKNLDELLATIVNPSAMIRKEYLSYQVHTTDGRVLNGLIAEQSPSRITLLGAKNERTQIERDQIESLDESPTSLMPDNLLQPLKPQELRDLFSYLQSDAALDSAAEASPQRK
jgi:putative membrane-bound dehydrogenase-like protein